jgi:hypothetical protein
MRFESIVPFLCQTESLRLDHMIFSRFPVWIGLPAFSRFERQCRRVAIDTEVAYEAG